MTGRIEVARINPTTSPIEQYDCTWTVDDFDDVSRASMYRIESPPFSTGAVRWTMNVGINADGFDPCAHYYVEVNIDPKCFRDDDEHVIAKYEIGVCTVRGRVERDPATGMAIYSHSRCQDVFEVFDKTRPKSELFKLVHFIEWYKLSYPSFGLLIDDTLTLNLHISFVGSSMRLTRSIDSRPADGASLSENLRQALMNPSLSDVTIVVDDGRRIPAHKVILAARSPVFAAMFKNTTKGVFESYCQPLLHGRLQLGRRSPIEKEVQIDDVEGEVVNKMLEYIYTGRLDGDISTVVHRLLFAADKYDLPELKFLCKERLLNDLTSDNAWDALVLAELHGAEQLRAAAVDVVLQKHGTEITKTAGWKNLLDNKAYHPIVEDLIAATIGNGTIDSDEDDTV